MVAVQRFDTLLVDSPDYRARWFTDCLLIPSTTHLNVLESYAQEKGQPPRPDIYVMREALICIAVPWTNAVLWTRRDRALQLIADVTDLGDAILSMNHSTEVLVA